MFNKIRFLLGLSLLCLFFACVDANNEPLLINFSSDSTKIIIKNINEAGLYQLKSKLKTDSAYQKLVSVLQTPGEDDSTSMELEWPGKLDLLQDSLIFTPLKPFEKGKSYLVETMLNVSFAKREEVAKSNVGHAVIAQQQMLKR